MSNRENLFRSKVARRVFLLFIISSLIPVLILAVLSLDQVRTVSTDQIVSRLKQDAKFYGLSLFDRLKVVEEELLFHASMLDAKGALPSISARDAGHLSDWHVHKVDRSADRVTEELPGGIKFDDGAIAHMKRGRSVLSVVTQQSSNQPALFMSRITNISSQKRMAVLIRDDFSSSMEISAVPLPIVTGFACDIVLSFSFLIAPSGAW